MELLRDRTRTADAGSGPSVHGVNVYAEQRAAGLEPVWQVNEQQGTGLLALPLLFPPGLFAQTRGKIEAQGYEIVEHDTFYVHMQGITYYQLRRRSAIASQEGA